MLHHTHAEGWGGGGGGGGRWRGSTHTHKKQHTMLEGLRCQCYLLQVRLDEYVPRQGGDRSWIWLGFDFIDQDWIQIVLFCGFYQIEEAINSVTFFAFFSEGKIFVYTINIFLEIMWLLVMMMMMLLLLLLSLLFCCYGYCCFIPQLLSYLFC